MNKAELVSAIATDAGVSKSVASKVLDSVINNVTESLKNRKEILAPNVSFSGFKVTTSFEIDDFQDLWHFFQIRGDYMAELAGLYWPKLIYFFIKRFNQF